MQRQHVYLELPGEFLGRAPSRRCCVCHWPEKLASLYRECPGVPNFSIGRADQKEMGRRRTRRFRKYKQRTGRD